MLRNTHVNVCFHDFIENEWQVKTSVRQGGICLRFYSFFISMNVGIKYVQCGKDVI